MPEQTVRYGKVPGQTRNRRSGRFTAGAYYTANRNRSMYENLGGEVFHQRQDRVYFFAEYFHRLGKWTITAGMGMQYTDFLFKESNRGSHSWSPRPRATVSNEQHMRLDMKMPYISIAYNLQWGRQKRSAEKLTDIDANADRSFAGGR